MPQTTAVTFLSVLLATSVLVSAEGYCQAQSWPTKPIRLLVGFPAGGPTDVVARIVGEKIAAQTGQQVVIDNRPGAAGNIAVEITVIPGVSS